jgi:transcriptional regulator with XRE-family HTH domain
MARKAPHPTDKYVGSRVRMRRVTLGMSQEKLGDALGLTFQQVQKYEKGTNRIGASRVQQIANILEVPVEFLFAGGPDQPRQDGLHETPSPAYLPDIHPKGWHWAGRSSASASPSSADKSPIWSSKSSTATNRNRTRFWNPHGGNAVGRFCDAPQPRFGFF